MATKKDIDFESLLSRTQVRFCNEVDVHSGRTLAHEFTQMTRNDITKYYFVAIVVRKAQWGTQAPNRETILSKYNVYTSRRGMLREDSHEYQWMWDMEVEGIYFIIFGPSIFTKETRCDLKLRNIIIRKKEAMPMNAPVFDTQEREHSPLRPPSQEETQAMTRLVEREVSEAMQDAAFRTAMWEAVTRQNRQWKEEHAREWAEKSRELDDSPPIWEITHVEPR